MHLCHKRPSKLEDMRCDVQSLKQTESIRLLMQTRQMNEKTVVSHSQ